MSLQQQTAIRFTYQRPDEEQVERIETLRMKLLDMAWDIEKYCLPGRERSIALTKLEEVMMWANAAIVREDKDG